ncbi:MAG: tetratricopeptide repeat protein [Desulfuromusa sp.]|jgi:tetratricopeptide (TPR) repeat protein|nr:tetratricopeptide repeat protein [Desulfuromusa sp.]
MAYLKPSTGSKVKQSVFFLFTAGATLLLLFCSVCFAIPVATNSLLNTVNALEDQSTSTDNTPIIQLANRVGAEELKNVNLLLQQQKNQEVIQKANLTIAKKPNSGLAYEVLGAALFMSEKWPEAIKALEKAKELEPRQSGPYTKLGIIYMGNGQIDLAQKFLLKAIDVNDKDRFAHQRLGLLLEDQKNYNQAIVHFRKGIEGTPSSYLGVTVNLARSLNQVIKYQEAADLLAPRLPVESTILEAQLVLAASFYRTGQYDLALERFQRALTLQPEYIPAELGVCMSLRKSGKASAALPRLKKLVKERPDWLPGVMELGETQLTLGQLKKAQNSFAKGVRLGADATTIQKRIASYYLDKKQFDKAQKVYLHLIDTGKGDPESYSQLSELYQAEGKLKQGLTLLQKGVNQIPESSYLRLRLGAYLGSLGQYDQAIPEFKRALADTPNDPNILRALSLAQVRAGENKDAVQTAAKLYTLFPDSISEAINYAARLNANGQIEKAETIYRQTLSAYPGNPVVQNNLANLLSNKGHLKEAEKLARAANATVKGKNAKILDTLGWILYQQKHFDEALQVLTSATALAPAAASIQYHHGMTLAATGYNENARKALNKAIELDSKANWATEALTELKTLK